MKKEMKSNDKEACCEVDYTKPQSETFSHKPCTPVNPVDVFKHFNDTGELLVGRVDTKDLLCMLLDLQSACNEYAKKDYADKIVRNGTHEHSGFVRLSRMVADIILAL